MTIRRSRVTCFPAYQSSWKQNNLPLSSSDLNLVNFLRWRALQRKLYSQDFGNVDHLKGVLLQC